METTSVPNREVLQQRVVGTQLAANADRFIGNAVFLRDIAAQGGISRHN